MIERLTYLNKLISKQWNGRIKIITGIRRSGKSTLLFEIYREHLLNTGVDESEIIAIALDDDINEMFRNPSVISDYVREKCADKNKKYYVFLDEIQFAISKEELRDKDKPIKLYSVLNGLLNLKNVDVYVTGSNSKLLSKDVLTEFRGRGDEVHLYPLSFFELLPLYENKYKCFEDYILYGGLPMVCINNDEKKKNEFQDEVNKLTDELKKLQQKKYYAEKTLQKAHSKCLVLHLKHIMLQR